jgi:hypothetical protein
MTDGTDGEVAIREKGTVTAVDVDSLDAPISVDLDHNPPLVGVPGEMSVMYEDDTILDEIESEFAADGGFVRDNVTLRQYGLGLTGDARDVAIAIMALAYAAAGYLWGADMGASSVIALLAGGFATYALFFHNRP